MSARSVKRASSLRKKASVSRHGSPRPLATDCDCGVSAGKSRHSKLNTVRSLARRSRRCGMSCGPRDLGGGNDRANARFRSPHRRRSRRSARVDVHQGLRRGGFRPDDSLSGHSRSVAWWPSGATLTTYPRLPRRRAGRSPGTAGRRTVRAGRLERSRGCRCHRIGNPASRYRPHLGSGRPPRASLLRLWRRGAAREGRLR